MLAPARAADAARLWDRMALAARQPGRAVRDTVPPELGPVLELFDAAGRGSLTGGPSVPSAGALYPYEFYAVVPGPHGWAVHAVDAARRRCRLVRRGPDVADALRDAGLDHLAGPVVVVALRPWLSMRKYGDRGYLYAQLDAAHVATHLLCLAAERHRHAELRTGAAATALEEVIGLADGCRFAHSALVLRGGTPSPVPGWSSVDGLGGVAWPEAPSWLERECWKSVEEHRPVRPAAPGTPVRPHALLAGAAEPAAGFPGGQSPTSLAARRRSTKDFRPEALDGATLDRVLAVLRTPLAVDLPPVAGLSATLVARNVRGRAPGCYPVRGTGPVCGPESAPVAAAPPEDELLRACMDQEHLRHAAALVLFHTARQDLLCHGIDDTLLRAGALAHLLYLGAAGEGVAITAIGGFDGPRWRALAGLPGRDEVLYVVLLGGSGGAALKLDRLQPAYAHTGR
ncbi:nitroreductase family protein [Saccharothrix syringae]|uniref:Nitroreductase domain-containing protein n=1 Tax=Saccharothrix syringae TaxID=103733 RepID=A0A5Q0H053_SACSY|nr:nitroreductase family protein [Saccharothrix syringae]QFZ19606.1 hypothetical protein EKG83_21165 [Saccharothrix syringae]